MSFLTLTHLKKSFGPVQVVHDFNMSIEKGEFVSFLGPSGCGKTTVLRMIAGFETPTDGTITINGKNQNTLRPNQRNIGMVFQAYALFPNMNVFDNVAFGLKVAGKPKAEIEARVKEMLGLIKLDHLADRYPYQMSGGQQQRVALARALAPKPQVLLLDEPLSNLDARLRQTMRVEIRRICKAAGVTAIYVTHDREEALSTADRIAVMAGGKLAQVGTPREVYERPASTTVATFLGEANLLTAMAHGNGMVACALGVLPAAMPDRIMTGAPMTVCIRPERLRITADGAIAGKITAQSFLGGSAAWTVRCGEFDLRVDEQAPPPRALGDVVRLSVAREDVVVLRS